LLRDERVRCQDRQSSDSLPPPPFREWKMWCCFPPQSCVSLVRWVRSFPSRQSVLPPRIQLRVLHFEWNSDSLPPPSFLKQFHLEALRKYLHRIEDFLPPCFHRRFQGSARAFLSRLQMQMLHPRFAGQVQSQSLLAVYLRG